MQPVSNQDEVRKKKTECKHGNDCRRKGCFFLHPDGREMNNKNDDDLANDLAALGMDDDDFGGEDDNDYIDGLAQTTSTNDWFPEYRNCKCCSGCIYQCKGEVCVQIGKCECSVGSKTEAATTTAAAATPAKEAPSVATDAAPTGGGGNEAWRDEWFPAARECTCCKGYVYRCDGTKGACYVDEKCKKCVCLE
jgi:hypothetical protein